MGRPPGRKGPFSANRLSGKALERRCVEVATAMLEPGGPDRYQLAAKYKVSTVTISRWRNIGQELLIPDIEDRQTWRNDMAQILIRHIDQADETGDSASLVKLMDRMSKLLGLDHSDRLDEARLALEARQAQAVVAALEHVLGSIGLEPERQSQARELLAGELERLA